jgi:hypothetical protein
MRKIMVSWVNQSLPALLHSPSEKYNIVSWKKKEFEDFKDLLVSFRLYFVIGKDSSYISTMYYLLL